MKLRNILSHAAAALALLCLLTGCGEEPEHFSIDVLNRFTPIKSQGDRPTCWVYAMLAAIETEHIMKGDSVNLSTSWVDRHIERDSLVPKTKRGMGITLVRLIYRYGLVPYDAMPVGDDIPPKWAFMLGVQYTPLEFAHSVCAPNEYTSVASSDAHPYYTSFILDVADNWEHNTFYNVPRDSLLALAERAVRQGHGICWEGDISEPGFDWKRGVARLSLLQGRTTDDHCMSIVGLAHDDGGKPFFVMKNSWGTKNAYNGLMYMSYDYFREKTVALFLPTSLINKKP